MHKDEMPYGGTSYSAVDESSTWMNNVLLNRTTCKPNSSQEPNPVLFLAVNGLLVAKPVFMATSLLFYGVTRV